MKPTIRSLAAACLLLPGFASQAQDTSTMPAPVGDTAVSPDAAWDVPAEEAGPGRFLLQLGLFHVDTIDQSRPLSSELLLLGQPTSFVSEGTGARVSTADTPALILTYFINDHIGLKAEGGIPAKFKVYGEGTVAPVGDILTGGGSLPAGLGTLLGQIPGASATSIDLGAEANNPLTKVTQWSPVAMVQYVFRDASATIRPYVGLGVTYTWFTGVKLDPEFEGELNNKFGTLLNLANAKTGATYVKAKASSAWAPVFNLGATANLDERWSLSGSVSYSLLSTRATIDIHAADGTRLSRSSTKLDLNPLVMSVLVGYRFDLF